MSNQDFLNPKFLKYFITVSDKGSILSASTELNVAQPSITRAIKIIENRLKKKLFTRTKKGVLLTKEGEIFYLNAKSILSFNDKIIENIKSLEIEEKTKIVNQITFGIPATLSHSHKENILWLLKKNNSNIRIKVVEDDSFEMINLIKQNKIDFAITCIDTQDKNILKSNLYSDPFCVAFYKGHKFQNLKEINIEMIRKEKNYIFRNTCEFFFYDYLGRKGVVPGYSEVQKNIKIRKENSNDRDIIFTNSDTTASACVKSGLGVAIIPESVAIDHKLLFKKISKPSINREIFFIQNKQNKNTINTSDEALKNALWL
ncbi:LysR family transcriptional regulator [Candidatus Pelagibacter sp. HIMB1485]|uniref:LysR family transcriptional regulator n=1 Tax=Candidatus Pelagibacter sp. HIMB1485 TaxID=3415415 RepID=UPI003F841DA0